MLELRNEVKMFPYEIEEAAKCEMGKTLGVPRDMSILADISGAPTLDAAIENLKMVNVAKEALRQADRFREQSVKYAMLECAALVRVVELGGVKSINPYRRRKAAEWLASLDNDERMEVIERCKDGLTVEHVYQIEIDNPRKEARAIVSAKNYADAVIDVFETMGCVSLSEFDEKLDSLPIAEDVAQGAKDRVRDKIRRLGGVGIGDGNGTYVDSRNANRIGEAIEVRIASMQADFLKLVSLAANCEDKPIVHIDTKHNMTDEMPIKDYFAVMLAASGVVKVFTNSSLKEAKIIEAIIDATFPDYWRSSRLYERLEKEFRCKGNYFTDKIGLPTQCYGRMVQNLDAKESANRRASDTMDGIMNADPFDSDKEDG